MSMFFGKETSRKIYNQVNTSCCTNSSLYCIEIDNLSMDKYCFDKINDTIKIFLEDSDVFFGFYRIDGLYLTTDEFERCSIDIPRFFVENGEYREIKEVLSTRKKNKQYCNFLTVARTVLEKKTFDELQWIFKYYLETTFFSPRISFDKFVDVHSNYMHQSASTYLLNGYTDFLFSFYDSNCFSVMFDPQKQNVDSICDTIKDIWNQSDRTIT